MSTRPGLWHYRGGTDRRLSRASDPRTAFCGWRIATMAGKAGLGGGGAWPTTRSAGLLADRRLSSRSYASGAGGPVIAAAQAGKLCCASRWRSRLRADRRDDRGIVRPGRCWAGSFRTGSISDGSLRQAVAQKRFGGCPRGGGCAVVAERRVYAGSWHGTLPWTRQGS
jgi:hypothetical protein